MGWRSVKKEQEILMRDKFEISKSSLKAFKWKFIKHLKLRDDLNF